MKREPTEKDLADIAQSIAADDRIEATNLYISITGCGLTEAQKFIRTLTFEMKEKEPEKFVRKPKKRHFFERF